MGRKKRWQVSLIQPGFHLVTLSRWQSFYEYIQQELLSYNAYIWRGQADPEWDLTSTFQRAVRWKLQFMSEVARKAALNDHLTEFKRSARGRRGMNPAVLTENDWWALGQHYGLHTPLLDWTRAPFVAAYFALRENAPKLSHRAVYALAPRPLVNEGKIELIEPDIHENPRLVVQSGLFTRASLGGSYRALVESVSQDNPNRMVLIKFLIPASDRVAALKALNRMNINHSSLFPDVFGAAKHCNMVLTVTDY